MEKRTKTIKIKINCDDLCIRDEAGTSCNIIGHIFNRPVVKIEADKSTIYWGKLYKQAGWIHLGYTQKA